MAPSPGRRERGSVGEVARRYRGAAPVLGENRGVSGGRRPGRPCQPGAWAAAPAPRAVEDEERESRHTLTTQPSLARFNRSGSRASQFSRHASWLRFVVYRPVYRLPKLSRKKVGQNSDRPPQVCTDQPHTNNCEHKVWKGRKMDASSIKIQQLSARLRPARCLLAAPSRLRASPQEARRPESYLRVAARASRPAPPEASRSQPTAATRAPCGAPGAAENFVRGCG